MTAVLVTDGNERSALAVVRSLGRAGYDVHVCSSDMPSLAGASRHARSSHLLSDPLRYPDPFAREVLALAQDEEVRVVLPVTDASMTSLLARREEFGSITIPAPSLEDLRAISDKGRVMEAARPLGIRTPQEVRLESPDDAAAAEGVEGRFPVVVKPRSSVVLDASGRRVKTRVAYADTGAELRRILNALPADAFPVLLQERVAGDGIGVFLLLWEGRMLAAFAHRRLREKPPSGGVSVLRESVALPADLLERSQRLLESFHWSGVAMVEYKGTASMETPVLMEVNGRFWGSLQLAIDAGVDFPRLLLEAALGKEVPPVLSYRTGVRCRWFWGDVDHLAARMRHSRRELHLPDDAPSRGRAVWDFLRAFAPGIQGEVLRWDDPVPALAETRRWLRRQ